MSGGIDANDGMSRGLYVSSAGKYIGHASGQVITILENNQGTITAKTKDIGVPIRRFTMSVLETHEMLVAVVDTNNKLTVFKFDGTNFAPIFDEGTTDLGISAASGLSIFQDGSVISVM